MTAILVSALAMTLIVGVRYLIASGAFAWATRLRHPQLYTGLDAQISREIRWSLASAAIYGVPAGVVAWGWQNRGWTRIYEDASQYPLWYLPLSVLLYLFAHDTWFYWTHRWMHTPRLFKVAHAVHHASRPPTAWAAMSFHPWEALTGAVVIPALVFLIPIHVGALGVVLSVMTVMGVTNHMGWEVFPRALVNGPVGNWLITATHHQRHHAEYRGNYGLYFRFWDRICGTDKGLGSFGDGRVGVAPRLDPPNTALRSPDMAGIAALQYATEGFDTSGRRLMGRQAAGEALLKAWVRYSGADPLTGWVRSRADAEGFARQVSTLGATHQPAIATHGAEKALVDAGALLLAGPQVSVSAWHRRHFPQDSWSIVGLTHTTSTHLVMDSTADLLVAPVQPWDALICTSRSVLATVERVLTLQQDYLADRMGAAPPSRPQLPVIPLGIHCDDFVPREGDRARWRAELGIGADDIVFLHLARLCFHAKAHPVPAYIALDAAARATGTRPHLVFAGWFEDDIQEEIFRAAAAHFEGTITTHFVDARTDDARRSIRAVADVFTLLVDNIQETFGLSPVEAMAAGLPCVVSDWDGFKDTVQHGVSGFRVPTLQPPPGSGEALVWRWDTEMIRSDHFVGGTAQAIAIDIPAATEAYTTLIADSGLRRRMGEAGQREARARFDYRVVIGHYTALFAELEAIRRSGTGEVAPRRPGHPARPSRAEPFDAFSSYPTAHLHLHTMLVAGPVAAPVDQVPAGFRAAIPVPWAIPKPVDLEAMRLHTLATSCTAGALIDTFGKTEPARTLRGVAWLIKYGYLAPVR